MIVHILPDRSDRPAGGKAFSRPTTASVYRPGRFPVRPNSRSPVPTFQANAPTQILYGGRVGEVGCMAPDGAIDPDDHRTMTHLSRNRKDARVGHG